MTEVSVKAVSDFVRDAPPTKLWDVRWSTLKTVNVR